jgi:transcriptional regulator with XRE-family HTH domain
MGRWVVVIEQPASMTTGEIIRHLREQRGMSRPVLAGLVGYSSDWLKRIERGERGIALPALLRLAKVLRVDDLSALIDGDTPMPLSAWEGPHHPAAAVVDRIVNAVTFTGTGDVTVESDIAALAAEVDQLWRDWHTLPDNRSSVAARLPTLIAELETATIRLDGMPRRRAHAALTSAYSLAQHLAVDLTEPETGRILVDRAVRSAQAADDPVSLAFGAWTYGHVLRGSDPDAALHLVADAGDALRRHLGDNRDTAGLLGSLDLHCAVSAAQQGHNGTAWRFWDAADRIGRSLPTGYSHPQTAFGVGNVAIHGVSIAGLLRRHGEVVQRASDIDADTVPSRERRGRLYGEIAAGHQQRQELDEVLHYLELAYVTSPEAAPYSPLTRGIAVELVRSARGPLKSSATALAVRMGILPAA